MILINHASGLIRKQRLSPANKAKRKASQNEFMEKGGLADRVKSFREVYSREGHPRPRAGFVQPI